MRVCLLFHFPGTSSIVDELTHKPLLSILTLIVETAVQLRQDGHRVVIVSSGAIGVGLQRMDVNKRPKGLSKLQVVCLAPLCLGYSANSLHRLSLPSDSAV